MCSKWRLGVTTIEQPDVVLTELEMLLLENSKQEELSKETT
jgi:hypothetical protein